MNDENIRQLEDDILQLKTKLEFYPDKATWEEIKTFIVKEHAEATKERAESQKWITWLVIALTGLTITLFVRVFT